VASAELFQVFLLYRCRHSVCAYSRCSILSYSTFQSKFVLASSPWKQAWSNWRSQFVVSYCKTL